VLTHAPQQNAVRGLQDFNVASFVAKWGEEHSRSDRGHDKALASILRGTRFAQMLDFCAFSIAQ